MKILIVDDDQINSKLFAKRLEKRNYEVDVVNSGKEALSYIEGVNQLVVLLDIIMPEMDGIEVIKEIRKRKCATEISIIMMTSKDETEQIVECLDLGANDYMTKPANIDIAQARINSQVRLLSLQQESLKKKQLETANAMIATYNHEINNPLTVALGVLRCGFDRLNEERLTRAIKAVERIAGIVKKIEAVTEDGNVEETDYVDDISMIKLKK